VVEAALASSARPVLVVTGHEAASVVAALAGLDVMFVDNPDYAVGLSSSLKAGIGAVPAGCDGALVLLGDMPQITGALIDRLIAAFAASPGDAIIVPTHKGRRGNPVLWSRAHFAEMLQLKGDAGAKRLMAAHAEDVREVDLGTDAIFADVDTPEALEELRGGQTPRA
jgi:molybdenum cofactor cytidylyltransferase